MLRRSFAYILILAVSSGMTGVRGGISATNAGGGSFSEVTNPVAGQTEPEASHTPQAENRISTPQPENRTSTTGPALRIGDKINLAVFVRLAHDKWDRQAEAADASRSFLQRAEFSGERTIQDNGVLALPLLGLIPSLVYRVRNLRQPSRKRSSMSFIDALW